MNEPPIDPLTILAIVEAAGTQLPKGSAIWFDYQKDQIVIGEASEEDETEP